MREQMAPGYARARRRHARRSRRARRADESRAADEVVRDPGDWDPPRNDLRGVDDAKRERIRSVRHADYEGDDPEYHHGGRGEEGTWATAERLATVAPVMGNPSLDPAGGDLVAVSYMAGYAGDSPVGFDAMQGVDRLVTGASDATRDLGVESNTPGAPLEMGRDESLFSDDAGGGTRRLDGDWCGGLRCDHRRWL